MHDLLKCLLGICQAKAPIETSSTTMIEGWLVLKKKNVLDFNDFHLSFLDNLDEFLGKRVSLQLVSATHADPERGLKGKLGKAAYLEEWSKKHDGLAVGEAQFIVNFEWDESFGIPGGFIIRNEHHAEFYLKALTLHHVPGKGRVHFVCNSWVYPAKKYNSDRVFFSNESYLPSETPLALKKLREEELLNLRGNGVGELKEWDRVYDYAYYNDLGNPDDPDLARPILGGSKEFPYPRRGRTGRPPTKTDPKFERRLPLLSLDIYVPRDERFGHLKMSDFLAYALKSINQFLLPEIKALFDKTPDEFDSFEDVMKMYGGGIKLPEIEALDTLKGLIPFEMIKELLRTDGERFLKFPLPQVIQEDMMAWRSDEEFAREMLAGVNPVVIRSLKEFPPKSKLDGSKYGNQDSSIRAHHIESNLQGLTVDEALKKNKLFILDHHDTFMPYLNRINSTTTKTYASRTLLFLQNEGTLIPLAIELSLPHPDGEIHGAISKVFTPCDSGVEASVWLLAKAHAAVNDSGFHQLISHWLNTHAVIEPFVIASNRQLSVLHPIHKLLHPHFRDTMNINALARQTLINAGGILEMTVFPGKYAMEMSAVVYKNWDFTRQGLPADLLDRGMAVVDEKKPYKLRLLIEDYPYAVDGLEIWDAISTWVQEYCAIYYPSDTVVASDTELQAWWTEVRNVGHGDKRKEPWWPEMRTIHELTDTITTMIWVASALHAAVNYGQYPYAGYMPNRPTISRRFMPEPGTTDYEKLESDPDGYFLSTVTNQRLTLLGVSLIEILSRHSSDELYLGQRESPEWSANEQALAAFERFGKRLEEIERLITTRNADHRLRNRLGSVRVPYTLLYPSTSDIGTLGGLTGRGIPNSISI
ncbi:hypothetical protein AMTRI_Chr03g44860 [Amborella trichopoda]